MTQTYQITTQQMLTFPEIVFFVLCTVLNGNNSINFICKLMDIDMISHTKAVVLNLGSTDRIDCTWSVGLDREKLHFYFHSPLI